MTERATLRLHYFPFPGRAGVICDALRIAGIPLRVDRRH